MDKFWRNIENSLPVSKSVEIINLTYTNSDFTKVSEIKEQFDSWTIKDFEKLIMEVQSHPTFEESAPEYSFGEREMPYPSDYYESCTVRDAPYQIWKKANSKAKNRKHFF